MKLSFPKRPIARRTILIAAALVAAASVVTGREKPAIEVVEPRPAQIEKTLTASDIDLAKLSRRQAEAPQSDPFAPRSFAPAVERSAAAPTAPSAPPLPFAYAGKLIHDGKTEIFVTRGNELISIAAGQKIDDAYRVDAIGESSIRFTYLPLKTRQSLELGEENG